MDGVFMVPLESEGPSNGKRSRPADSDEDEDEDETRSGEGHDRKRQRPIFAFNMSFEPNRIRPSFLIWRLKYARACRETHTRQIRTTRSRLLQAKIEISMLMEEIREFHAKRAEIDHHIGELKALMIMHNISTPIAASHDDVSRPDDGLDTTAASSENLESQNLVQEDGVEQLS